MPSGVTGRFSLLSSQRHIKLNFCKIRNFLLRSTDFLQFIRHCAKARHVLYFPTFLCPHIKNLRTHRTQNHVPSYIFMYSKVLSSKPSNTRIIKELSGFYLSVFQGLAGAHRGNENCKRQQSSARTALGPSRPQRLICSRRRAYIPATVPRFCSTI